MARLLSRIDRIRAHACRWAMLPLTSVPSAVVSDDDTRQWSADMYDRDLADEPETRTGEESATEAGLRIFNESIHRVARLLAEHYDTCGKCGHQYLRDGECLSCVFAAGPPRTGMRPRVLRRRLGLAFLGAILAGAVLGTGVAKADPVDDYVLTYAPAVCSTLDKYPTVGGVEGILQVIIQDDGFTPYQAGQIIGRAVIGWCPEHSSEVNRFIAKWTTGSTVRA